MQKTFSNGGESAPEPQSRTVNTYAVIIPAKNEEQYIGNTLNALCSQTLKPSDIIVVDDNSNDDTRKIASSYEFVTVISSNLPDENHLVNDKIGAVVAEGIRYIKSLNKNYDYVVLVGSDDILATTYMEKIINYMKNDEVDFATGWNPARSVTIPTVNIITGSGTVMKMEIMNRLSLDYLSQTHYETYMGLFATVHGYVSKFYDISFNAQRKAGTNYPINLKIVQGKYYRAFGINSIAALYLIITRSTSFANTFFQICGLCSFHIEYTDPAIQKYMKNYIKKEFINKIKILKRLFVINHKSYK